jgi:broad specificity phosphatase PhoE
VLILVRHGQTEANAAGLLQGRLDLPLDQHGQLQAQQVAAAIGPVDVVISSPLVRATETAAHFTTAERRVDDRWLELSYGVYEGRRMSDLSAEERWRWRTENDFAPQGGESLAALAERVRSACVEIAAEAADRTVVVVTHVSPMKAAVAWALGVDIGISWRCQLGRAAVCRIATAGPTPSLTAFNERLWQQRR